MHQAKSLRASTMITLLSYIFTVERTLEEVFTDSGPPINCKQFHPQNILPSPSTERWLHYMKYKDHEKYIDESQGCVH